jgi:predicted nucleic acid-binding protein
VSGDHHLLDLKAYKKIAIVTPVEFLALLNPPAEPPADEPPKE